MATAEGITVVTGATGSVGTATVDLARKRGHQVVVTVLPDQKVAEVDSVELRVEDSVSVDAGFAEIDRIAEGARIRAVIHLAAIELPSLVEHTEPEALDRVLRVNVIGTHNVMRAAIPRLRSGDGNLVLASSLWGMLAAPFVGTYAASKHAIQALAEAARRETRGTGVRITHLNIGAVKSEMLARHVETVRADLEALDDEHRDLYQGLYRDHIELNEVASRLASSPERVARALVRISEKPRPRPSYRVGMDAHVVRIARALLSESLLDRALGRKG